MDDDLQPAQATGTCRGTREPPRSDRTALRLLELTPKQAAPAGPAQPGFFATYHGIRYFHGCYSLGDDQLRV